MKLLPKPHLPVFTLGTGLMVACAGAFGFREPAPLDDKATDAAVTSVTTKILESSQIAHRRLDDELAGGFLDRYLDTLDAGRMLFLKGDLDEFARFRPTLAESIRRRGDSSPAHLIFDRFLERLDQRAASTTAMLENDKFEFTGDETFFYERKDAPRPADMDAAKALWKQQLRYEYLQEKLAGKKEADIVKTLTRRQTRTAATMRKFDRDAVLELYLQALALTYDPHSDYMGAEQLKSFEIAMNLKMTGIGASLRSLDGYCKIMELVPGGPAARSGLLNPGDRIVGVSQKEGDEFEDIIDLPITQTVELIRGKKGTPVILDIIPADAADESERKTITIVREEIKLEDQQAKARIIDLPAGDATQRIGVIDLPSFYAGEGDGKGAPTSCSADVEKLIGKLGKEGVTGIVLDLRINGGGSLQEAIDLTGLFIKSGAIVQTRNLEGRLEVGIDHDRKVAWDGPLVVLTSRFSASASEILAGALQDYGRAVIVGDTATFGKGTVQTIIPLGRVMQSEGIVPGSDPGALKVTISKFYRPSGKSTQLEGVKADIVIPSLTDLPEISEADLENALPWDTIKEAAYMEMNRVSPVLAALRSGSEKRIAKDPDFVDLKADIGRFTKQRADKSVSLNESLRQKEKDDLKARDEAAEKARLARATTPPPAYEVTLKNYKNPGLGDPVKPEKPKLAVKSDSGDGDEDNEPGEDIVLREAQNILIDYAALLKQQVVSQR